MSGPRLEGVTPVARPSLFRVSMPHHGDGIDTPHDRTAPMTRLFPARRSAERFDSLVEGGRRDDVDRATSDLLELVGALRSVPEAQARPEFVADLREQLMVAAAAELTSVPAAARERDDVARLTITPRRTRRERRVGIALGAVAIIGATTSMAVASQSAIPGDALYPVKRAIENTQTGFSVGDDAKGETILGNASGRLDEVDKLTQQDRPDAQLVTHTLNTSPTRPPRAATCCSSDYEQNGNEASIGQLHSHAQDSMGALAALDDLIPPTASPRPTGGRLPTTRCSTPRRWSSRSTPRPPTRAPTAAPGSPRSRRSWWPGGPGAHRRGQQRWPAASCPAPTPAWPTGAAQPQQNGGKGDKEPERAQPARDADRRSRPAQRRRDRRPAACSRPVAPTRTPVVAAAAAAATAAAAADTAARTQAHPARRPHPGHRHGQRGRQRCRRGRQRPAERPHRRLAEQPRTHLPALAAEVLTRDQRKTDCRCISSE